MEIESQIEMTPEGVWVRKGDRLSESVKRERRLDADHGFVKLISRHITPGSLAVDIGANIGDHTIGYLQAVGLNGSVVAYEPHPVLYECLCRNCPEAINFPYALGDQIGIEQLHMEPGDDAGSSYIRGHPEDLPVKMSTLDEDLSDIVAYRPLSLIKIDAEGCEPEILKGGEETIRVHHPTLVIEVNRHTLSHRGHTAKDIKDFLDKHKYRHHFISGNWSSERTDIICL
jgi:FkbM family methyltransferase